MSYPTRTYGKAVNNDCDLDTGFTKTDNGNTSTFSIDSDDYFKLDVTVSGGAEETKVRNDVNYGVSTNSSAYPLIMWRYVCSNANIKAKIICTDDAAYSQTVLVDSNSESFAVGSATLTTGQTLDHIDLYADHAVGVVYYDFIIVYEGLFTFPSANLVNFRGPPLRAADLPIPGKDGIVHQNLGSDPAEVHITADLDVDDTTWGLGKIFDKWAHERSTNIWQWTTLPAHDRAFKTRLVDYNLPFTNGQLSLDCLLKEYKKADAKSQENYVERFGY